MTDWGDEDSGGAGTPGEAGPDDEPDTARDPADDASDGEPSLYYGSVDEFLREYLRSVYRRAINGRSRVWATRWWEHPEAVIRLEALWRSWQHLRQDPTTGMSVWWRDHADHHMPALMDPTAPSPALRPKPTKTGAAEASRCPTKRHPLACSPMSASHTVMPIAPGEGKAGPEWLPD